MTDHPITPPPELVQQWRHKWTEGHGEFGVYLATQAARWGADERQEAIIHWLITGPYGASIATAHGGLIHQLCNAMRPKPPSLKIRIAEAIAKGDKHQALHLLDEALSDD
jgi:hypothetical protein